MMKTTILDEKQRYAWYRHHAWAGAILLSVVLAIQYFIELDHLLLVPIVGVLILYIVISLMFTYRYSRSLTIEEKTSIESPSEDLQKAQLHAETEKEQLSMPGPASSL